MLLRVINCLLAVVAVGAAGCAIAGAAHVDWLAESVFAPMFVFGAIGVLIAGVVELVTDEAQYQRTRKLAKH